MLCLQLENTCAQFSARLEHEKSAAIELRQSLDRKSGELDVARKNHNRDRPINGFPTQEVPSPTFKADLNSAREEIKGLK